MLPPPRRPVRTVSPVRILQADRVLRLVRGPVDEHDLQRAPGLEDVVVGLDGHPRRRVVGLREDV